MTLLLRCVSAGIELPYHIRLEGPEDPHRTNSRFLRSRDPAHASLPLAQTPWGLTGRAWLQAGAQQVAIVVSHNSHDSQIPIGIAASGSRDW